MIKILGYNYKILSDNEVDTIAAFGRYHAKEQILRVAKNIHTQQTESTILHEIIEALNYHLNLAMPHPSIMSLEAGLYQVFADNGIDLSSLLSRIDANDD